MKMKKLTAILCALLIACLTASACAEIPSSDLYIPAVSETFRTLVGGKTFEARVDGKKCYGEDEDGRYSRFDEEHVQRAYNIEEIRTAAVKAGMRFVTAYDAFTADPPKPDSERIYIVLQEQGK